MKILPSILLLAVAVAGAAPATLSDQLNAIDHAAAGIKDLTARFEQRKFTALLTKPLISSGLVRGAGAVVRWDTREPAPSVLYADRAELRLYYPDQKLEEIYPVDQRMSDLLASPLPRLSTIKEHFTIEIASPGDVADLPHGDATLALRLTPIDAALAAHLRQVFVVLDVHTGLALAIRTIDPDDDRTDITFSDMRVNTGLDEASVDLAVPAGTAISRPLAAAAPANHASR
jgi:outer membrane lipoprotein-sorting protein